MVWLAPLGMFWALDAVLGGWRLAADLRQGDNRALVTWALAGLLCGIGWELWNSGASARWTYAVSHVGWPRLFEMPLCGYLGYLAFGISCSFVADAVGFAVAESRSGSVAPLRPACQPSGQPPPCHPPDAPGLP
jgi:hypothetical protein